MTLLEEIKNGESVSLEFKEARPKDSLKFTKTVVAFANGRRFYTTRFPRQSRFENGKVALLPLVRGEVVSIFRNRNNLFLNLSFRISSRGIEKAFSLELDKVSVNRPTVCPVALRGENRRWINALEMQTVF